MFIKFCMNMLLLQYYRNYLNLSVIVKKYQLKYIVEKKSNIIRHLCKYL